MPLVVSLPAAGVNQDWRTPDVAVRQVLHGFPADRLPYHHRLLLLHLGDARWVVATPSGDIHPEDFAGEDVVPLQRGQEIPGGCRPAFVFAPFSEAEMRSWTAAASALAGVLGAVVPAPAGGIVGAQWLFGDTAFARFDQAVPVETLTDPDRFMSRGAAGLAQVQEAGAWIWTFVEHVLDDDRASWIADKREGAGRDPRLLPLSKPEGDIPLSIREATKALAKVPTLGPSFRGTSSAIEVATSLASTGMDVKAYSASWEQASGISPTSQLAREMRLLLCAFVMLLTVDRLDVGQTHTAEHIARRIVQIQKAVKRNPKNPDFGGLELLMAHMSEAAQGIETRKFDEYLSTEMKTEYQITKNQRQIREEADAAAKQRKGKAGKDEG
jgi:hypothetical protein